MSELPKAYDPAEAEEKWYRYWYERGLFEVSDDPDAKPYTIVMPPPNVTGMLTLGHVLNNTIQDLYIRWHRMRGHAAVWVPGTDHAGIATQVKVVESLRAEGIDYRQLGREGFVERVWLWRENFGGIILSQLKTLGVSVDWDRLRFTLDEPLSQAVCDVFVRLFDEGLIYKGKKIVNWSPASQTTLSDEEVRHRDVNDKLYTLRYRRADGTGTILVATVRPETIFGDVAVAVNPEDERYRDLVGTRVVVPLVGREVPVVADAYAKIEFGSGAVKITPAHDPNDYEVGLRHELPMPNTINPDGTMNELAGPLAGLDRFEARRRAVEMLESEDLIESIEDYTHSVGYSERGGEPIEPYLSDQWFVRMEPLAEPALEAVRQGHIHFHPEHWVKTYEHWLRNVRDWPISRQLWWGHRIPVYYAEDGRFTAAHTVDEARTKLHLPPEATLRQDEDVLDTWFSSWLWPFSVHGWGSLERNDAALRNFYPTDLLVTGPDIIFFWVARMIMAGLKFMQGEPGADGTPRESFEDRVPFRDVYFTSMIRDMKGRKMSKSLGNSPDPLEVIRTYGADALRFTIIYLAPTGQDVRFSEELCELGRNFANKVWNAGRFLAMKWSDAFEEGDRDFPGELSALEPITDSDRWILSRFHSTLDQVFDALERYRINEYSKLIYDFVWRDFCDWYVELLKTELSTAGSDRLRPRTMLRFAFGLYDQVLRMLHPIMPFVTEEIWQTLRRRPEGAAIAVARFPHPDPHMVSVEVESEFAFVQEATEAIRRMRGEASVPPSRAVDVVISASDADTLDVLERTGALMRRLARIESLEIGTELAKPTLSATEVVGDAEVHVRLEGLIDIDREREKTSKEIDRLEGQLRSVRGKLDNERFVANAPEEVVDREREKLTMFEDQIARLRQTLRMYEG